LSSSPVKKIGNEEILPNMRRTVRKNNSKNIKQKTPAETGALFLFSLFSD